MVAIRSTDGTVAAQAAVKYLEAPEKRSRWKRGSERRRKLHPGVLLASVLAVICLPLFVGYVVDRRAIVRAAVQDHIVRRDAGILPTPLPDAHNILRELYPPVPPTPMPLHERILYGNATRWEITVREWGETYTAVGPVRSDGVFLVYTTPAGLIERLPLDVKPLVRSLPGDPGSAVAVNGAPPTTAGVKTPAPAGGQPDYSDPHLAWHLEVGAFTSSVPQTMVLLNEWNICGPVEERGLRMLFTKTDGETKDFTRPEQSFINRTPLGAC